VQFVTLNKSLISTSAFDSAITQNTKLLKIDEDSTNYSFHNLMFF